jgi:hypothetical protein
MDFKKIKKILFILLIILILSCVFFVITNRKVVPTAPTVTFYVKSNSISYQCLYRISNSTVNGWSPFKWKYLDEIRNVGLTFIKKKITISKKGSIYIYSPSFKYRYGGGLKILGKDIVDGSTITVNARMKLTPARGEVYIVK